MFPQKKLKIQGVAGAFWGGFDTRAQLTVHTRALAYCASQSPQPASSRATPPSPKKVWGPLFTYIGGGGGAYTRGRAS